MYIEYVEQVFLDLLPWLQTPWLVTFTPFVAAVVIVLAGWQLIQDDASHLWRFIMIVLIICSIRSIWVGPVILVIGFVSVIMHVLFALLSDMNR